MSRDAEWFRQTFLELDAPSSLSKDDDPWPYVRGFLEYDGLATVVAATAVHPELFTKFFDPYKAPNAKTLVVGISANLHGVRDGKRVFLCSVDVASTYEYTAVEVSKEFSEHFGEPVFVCYKK